MIQPKYEFRGVSPANYAEHRYVCNVLVKDVNNDINLVFNDVGINYADEIDLPITFNFTEYAEKIYPDADNPIELGQEMKRWLKDEEKIVRSINAAYMKDSLKFNKIMSYERNGGECHAELLFSYKGSYLDSEKHVLADVMYPYSEVFDYPSTCQLINCDVQTSIEKAMVLEALRKEIGRGMDELYFENSIYYEGISYTEFGGNEVEANVKMSLYKPDGVQERTYVIRGKYSNSDGLESDYVIECPIEDTYDEFALAKIEGMISYSYSKLNEDLECEYAEYLEEIDKDKGDYSYGYY